MYDIILAHNSNCGIGHKGKIPWNIPEELKLFRKITTNSVLIMGRKTVEELPKLPDRVVFCVSKSGKLEKDNNDSKIFSSIEDALLASRELYPGKKVFVAGGRDIYMSSLIDHIDQLDKVHVSLVDDNTVCDTNFNIYSFIPEWNIVYSEKFEKFTYYTLQEKNDEEQQYLDLLKKILRKGEERKTRNSITKSLFHENMHFDLRNGFPLLTTKKMFFRGIVEELLFFIRGATDSKILEEKKVNIWRGNTDRKFLDSLGMKNRKEGIMGPIYGYQWRYYNAKYDENTGKPLEKGIDQLQLVIDTIRKDPYSRRIMMTDFNPSQVSECVLYPCHSIIIQFYVKENYLDMYCYNRSQDVFLGTPFNIASSALFLSLVAKVTNLVPRYLHMGMGDVHIYENHYSCVKEQVKRFPYKFPKLVIKGDIKDLEEMGKLQSEDILLENYVSHESIKAEMVA